MEVCVCNSIREILHMLAPGVKQSFLN